VEKGGKGKGERERGKRRKCKTIKQEKDRK
jgi:hypothetical protein